MNLHHLPIASHLDSADLEGMESRRVKNGRNHTGLLAVSHHPLLFNPPLQVYGLLLEKKICFLDSYESQVDGIGYIF